MSNPRYGIGVAALTLATATAGCGGSGTAQPLLSLREDNAASIAAEALLSTGVAGSQLGSIIPSVAAEPGSLALGSVQWLLALATGPQYADGTVTNPCGISGTITVTTAGMTTTLKYDHCMDQTSSSVDGTLQSTRQASSDPNRTTRIVSFDLTGTRGTRTVVETGGFTTVETLPQISSDPTELELLGDSFTVAVSFDGKLRDRVTLLSFDVDAFDQLTATVQQVKHFHYDVDSSRLQGRISVMSTQDVKFGTSADPFTGQILVSGANHTRLQITILGDEFFIPPAGQGQVELQIDPGTGTFGAPIWTSWLALAVLSGLGM